MEPISPVESRLRGIVEGPFLGIDFFFGIPPMPRALLRFYSSTAISPFGTLLGRCGSLRSTSSLTLCHGTRRLQVILVHLITHDDIY